MSVAIWIGSLLAIAIHCTCTDTGTLEDGN